MPAKILVVDDEPNLERLFRQRFRKKIRNQEYSFEFAINGLQALDRITEAGDIDIVLTDINMPQMDGLTFLSRLHENHSHIKTVMVSAYGDLKNIRMAMNQGAYDFVTKPIDFEDLNITINKAIREIKILKQAEQDRLALDHIHKELTIANEIQQSILPKNFNCFPPQSPYELYAQMIPAKEVGGDFYDFFTIDDNHLGIVIGDVSGKGMPAALFMAITRTLLKATGLKSHSASECLEQVNTIISQDNPATLFVTVFYAILNLTTGQLEYSSGGHNPPLLMTADGKLQPLGDSQNPPLGIVENRSYQSKSIQFQPGASLVLFTDGITEAIARDGSFFSDQRLEEHLQQLAGSDSKTIIKSTISTVQAFAKGAPQSDDITMVVLQAGG